MIHITAAQVSGNMHVLSVTSAVLAIINSGGHNDESNTSNFMT